MARIKCNGLVVDTFGNQAEAAGTALFLNGLPAAIGPLPAVVSAMKAGWCVHFPQYPGTYDSDGKLTVVNSVNSIANFYRQARAGKLGEVKLPDVVIAHSFGALILVELLRTGAISPKSAYLLAPVFEYGSRPDIGVREDLLQNIEEVKAERPRTYRFGGNGEWRDVSKGKQLFNLTSGWEGEARIVLGDGDDIFDFAIAKEMLGPRLTALTGGRYSLVVVPGAGHAMHELLTPTGDMKAFLEKAL